MHYWSIIIDSALMARYGINWPFFKLIALLNSIRSVPFHKRAPCTFKSGNRHEKYEVAELIIGYFLPWRQKFTFHVKPWKLKFFQNIASWSNMFFKKHISRVWFIEAYGGLLFHHYFPTPSTFLKIISVHFDSFALIWVLFNAFR